MSEERPFPITKLSAGDKKLTELFVERAKVGDKYKCWGCNKEFDNEADFVKHFQGHINEFFKGGS
jgi:hypothetical protein